MVVLPGESDYNAVTTPMPLQAHVNKDSLRIDMEIKFPKKEKKAQKKLENRTSFTGSTLSSVFSEQKYPEPVYFQSVDCVGIPNFFSHQECTKIIDFAEMQGFSLQNRHRVLNMMWTDLIDPFLAEALWEVCGLSWFLRSLSIDGQVPCGLNDVIRIQKYGPVWALTASLPRVVCLADTRTNPSSEQMGGLRNTHCESS